MKPDPGETRFAHVDLGDSQFALTHPGDMQFAYCLVPSTPEICDLHCLITSTPDICDMHTLSPSINPRKYAICTHRYAICIHCLMTSTPEICDLHTYICDLHVVVYDFAENFLTRCARQIHDPGNMRFAQAFGPPYPPLSIGTYVLAHHRKS